MLAPVDIGILAVDYSQLIPPTISGSKALAACFILSHPFYFQSVTVGESWKAEAISLALEYDDGTQGSMYAFLWVLGERDVL
jgi:hypothetical protein